MSHQNVWKYQYMSTFIGFNGIKDNRQGTTFDIPYSLNSLVSMFLDIYTGNCEKCLTFLDFVQDRK